MPASIICIAFCALAGLCTIGRQMGLFGTFLLARATTVLAALAMLLLAGPSRRVEWRCWI